MNLILYHTIFDIPVVDYTIVFRIQLRQQLFDLFIQQLDLHIHNTGLEFLFGHGHTPVLIVLGEKVNELHVLLVKEVTQLDDGMDLYLWFENNTVAARADFDVGKGCLEQLELLDKELIYKNVGEVDEFQFGFWVLLEALDDGKAAG